MSMGYKYEFLESKLLKDSLYSEKFGILFYKRVDVEEVKMSMLRNHELLLQIPCEPM